jgi:hypothetical protein
MRRSGERSGRFRRVRVWGLTKHSKVLGEDIMSSRVGVPGLLSALCYPTVGRTSGKTSDEQPSRLGPCTVGPRPSTPAWPTRSACSRRGAKPRSARRCSWWHLPRSRPQLELSFGRASSRWRQHPWTRAVVSQSTTSPRRSSTLSRPSRARSLPPARLGRKKKAGRRGCAPLRPQPPGGVSPP